MRLHHVQIACPVGGEDLARQFYSDGLGFREIAKPSRLAGRGGVWFRSPDPTVQGAELHVGVEENFKPAAKAHPAFLVSHEKEFEAVAARLDAMGYNVDWTEKHTFPGYLRFHVLDPHGNRIEILCP